LDDTPAIWRSIIPWLATATTLAGIRPARIYLHHVCELPTRIAQLCALLGVNTQAIAPFNAQNPYTNKIRQCATDFGAVESVVLTDVDLVFASPPPFGEIQGVVSGKLVDMPNPPLELLQEIFSAAGISPIQTCSNAYINQGEEIAFETILGNFNGGMYIIPRKQLAQCGERWSHWAHWLASNASKLRQWERNVDQIAFCLTVNEGKMHARILDDRWNFPTHVRIPTLRAEPYAFHHHALLDDDLNLLPVSDPESQTAMQRVNRAIQDFRQQYSC
jgi:hypothetical protein